MYSNYLPRCALEHQKKPFLNNNNNLEDIYEFYLCNFSKDSAKFKIPVYKDVSCETSLMEVKILVREIVEVGY